MFLSHSRDKQLRNRRWIGYGALVLGVTFMFFLPTNPVFAQTRAWTSTYDGPDFEYERGEYVCMDADLNVYVTGRKVDAHGADDYLVIKYNANGVQQWSRTYDGGTGDFQGYDRPGGIGVDGQGNVYVTGKSRKLRGIYFHYDFLTIKYNANGTQQWTKRFRTQDGGEDTDDIPYDMHVDADGNQVITGESGGGFLTVKYNSAGTELWNMRYNDPWQGAGGAVGVDVDAAGNAYVCGDHMDLDADSDYVTIKYSPSGTEEWVSRYHVDELHGFVAEDIDVTDSGMVAVTGNTCLGDDACLVNFDYDITTVKYDTNGTQLWEQTYAGPGDGVFVDEFAEGVAIDAAGNVYVTGHSYQVPGQQSDIITFKYNSDGTQAWMRLYNETVSPPTTADSYDTGHDIGVDGNGNVYVLGVCHVYNSVWIEEDWVTLSYDADGDLRWADVVDSYEPLPTDPEAGWQLMVDASGNVAATGYTYGITTFRDSTTAFYAGSDELFLDGFETGDTSRWSDAVGE